uniref:Uncharacterized protein n=1 Tax=Oryza nivara TaxID=4536 RepID=A0A0E0GYL5_ORYNI
MAEAPRSDGRLKPDETYLLDSSCMKGEGWLKRVKRGVEAEQLRPYMLPVGRVNLVAFARYGDHIIG